jgi:hypothetical protein
MEVKRIWCHHKMVFYKITRGATGISDPLQMISGRLDEHDGMRFWPPIFLTDITQFLLAHGDVALTNDMPHHPELSQILDFPTTKLINNSVYLITRIHSGHMFFGMEVKRIWCHHKMVFYKITRGATGISDPLQMISGRLDEHAKLINNSVYLITRIHV